MRLSKLVGVIAITLIQEATSQAPPTRASANALRDTESNHLELELQRRIEREDLDDLISGTLTITIAPDATCGHYHNGHSLYACGDNRPCTWESGLINRVFCHWERLYTTCLGRTERCDKDCLSNGYFRRCAESLSPSCDLFFLGDGIYGHYCAETKTGISLDTTWGREPEDLTTVVVVNRSQVSLVVNNEDSESTSESEPERTTESTPETSPSTTTDLETTGIEGSQTTSTTTSPLNGPHKDVNTGAIVGGVVGGLAVVGLTVGFLGFLFLRRRRRPEETSSNGPTHNGQQQPYTTEAKGTPFERLRQLVSGSNPPVELQGDAASPVTEERSGMGN